MDKKEKLLKVTENEKVFLDFLDYLFPYLESEYLVLILNKYKEWLGGE